MTYDEVTVDTYQVIEKIDSVAGVTYDAATHTFTVTVTDIGGQLQATVTGHHSDSVEENGGSFTVKPVFHNTYNTASVSIDVEKLVTDTSANPGTSKAGFSFVAVETDDSWQPKVGGMSTTEISDGAGEARFTATYKDAGTTLSSVRPMMALPVGLMTRPSTMLRLLLRRTHPVICLPRCRSVTV